jgi:hypothetical protein
MKTMIGLVGKKGSGKDTMADFLVSEYGYHKLAMADPLKKACKILFDFSDEQLNDHERKEKIDDRWGISPRQAFQKMGTDLIRKHICDDFWLRRADIEVGHYLEESVVISDIRFPNEAEWVKHHGGILVRIHSPCPPHKEDTHSSEVLVDDIVVDHELLNDKSVGLDTFHLQIATLMKQTSFHE